MISFTSDPRTRHAGAAARTGRRKGDRGRWALWAALLPLLAVASPLEAQEFGGGLSTWRTQWWAPPGMGVQLWAATSPERTLRLRGTVGGEWGGRTGHSSICYWFEGACGAEPVRYRTSMVLGDLTAQVVTPPLLGIRLGLGGGAGVRWISHRREGLESGRVDQPANAEGSLRPAFHWGAHAERRGPGPLRLELGIQRTRIVTLECPADASCLGGGTGLTRFVLGAALHR